MLQYLRKLETDRGGWVYVDLFRFVTHVFRVTLTLVQFVLVFIPDKEKSRMFIMEEVGMSCERRRARVRSDGGYQLRGRI